MAEVWTSTNIDAISCFSKISITAEHTNKAKEKGVGERKGIDAISRLRLSIHPPDGGGLANTHTDTQDGYQGSYRGMPNSEKKVK